MSFPCRRESRIMKKPITFITGNKNKVAYTTRYTSIPLMHKNLDIPEIQSLNVRKVVELKAREAYRQLRQPVLVEDTALVFHELGKLPGTFIRWFLEEIGNEGMCRMLDGKERSATITVAFALFDGETIHICDGIRHGSIADHPRGEYGFGWDPIFIPEGFTKTNAELTSEERSSISVRKIALKKLEKILTGKKIL